MRRIIRCKDSQHCRKSQWIIQARKFYRLGENSHTTKATCKYKSLTMSPWSKVRLCASTQQNHYCVPKCSKWLQGRLCSAWHRRASSSARTQTRTSCSKIFRRVRASSQTGTTPPPTREYARSMSNQTTATPLWKDRCWERRIPCWNRKTLSRKKRRKDRKPRTWHFWMLLNASWRIKSIWNSSDYGIKNWSIRAKIKI